MAVAAIGGFAHTTKGGPRMSWNSVHESWRKIAGTTKEALGSLLPERSRTDESLRVERDKTDRAIASRQDNAARRADAVVELARDNADAVVSTARNNADAVLDAARNKASDTSLDPGVGRLAKATLNEERGLADEALRDERMEADELLHVERQAYARALRGFLPLERESTDRYLKSERNRSDAAIGNRDDFLAIVTHDLRDLLGGIVISSTVIAQSAPSDEDGRTTLAETTRIKRYAGRMNRLIGDLMDIASIDSGKLAVTCADGDLAAVIAEAAEAFEASASARGIALESRIDNAPLRARFDHGRILQVLSNLIANSLKFTPPGGSILLSGERDGDDVHVSVVDTGSGIPEAALESVFDRFSQAGGNDRRGLGLGLYISRCLLEAHGGRISAHSKPGAGTRISLVLPAQR